MLQQKKKMLFGLLLLLICVLWASIYYYGLHLNFWADPEYGIHTLMYYYADEFGYSYPFSNKALLSQLISFVVYKIWGVGFKGLRIIASIKYFIGMFFCIVVSTVSIKDKKIHWYLVPFFCFITVIINPGMTEYCGFNMNTYYHQYPYDMHMEEVIFVLMACLLLDFIMVANTRRKKIFLVIALFLICVLGIVTGTLYVAIAVPIPLCCYFIAQLWRKDKKTVINMFLMFLGVIALLRVLSQIWEPLSGLFSMHQLDYAQSNVPGNIGFANFENIWYNISHSVVSLFSLFNVELSGKGILSLRLFTIIIRIVIVCFIYFTAFKTIRGSFREKKEDADLVSVVCSYAIILITCYVMFSKFGEQPRAIRYFLLVLYFGVILLCRNMDTILQKITDDIRYVHRVFFIIFMLCILIEVRPVWRENSAEYQKDYQELVDVLEEKKLGIGMADIWTAAPVVELSEGECVVVIATDSSDANKVELYVEEYGAKEVKIDYLIVDVNIEIADIEAIYGKADQYFETSAYRIYYYENGMVR